ncbi:MAG: hypothetical protein ACYCW6_05285 [Candidatus Xenobia bacterium]
MCDARQHAVDANGLAWKLLEEYAKTRRAEDADRMLDAAHTSLFFWREAGTPTHVARGHWLVSRVCSNINQPEAALYHARRAFEITRSEKLGGFELGYAHEGMARALAAAGHTRDAKRYLEKAQAMVRHVENPEDRRIYEQDLQAEPWFGLSLVSEQQPG